MVYIIALFVVDMVISIIRIIAVVVSTHAIQSKHWMAWVSQEIYSATRCCSLLVPFLLSCALRDSAIGCIQYSCFFLRSL